MVQSTPSRRDLLKTSAALASVGLLSALSGCSNGGDGGDGSDGGDGGDDGPGSGPTGLDAVPASATAVFTVDVEGLLSGDVKRVMNASLAAQPDGPSSVDEALTQFKEDEGIDPNKVSTMTVFADSSMATGNMTGAMSGESYAAGILYTDFQKSEVQTAIDNQSDVSYSESTYEGKTLWTEQDSEQVMAYWGGGTILAGSDAAVKDTIDLFGGAGEAVSGDLRTSFENTGSAPIRFAMQMPETDSGGSSDGSGTPTGGMGSITEKMTYISGRFLYSDGGNLGLAINLLFEDEESAGQLSQSLNALIQQYKMQAEQQSGEQAAEMVELLEKITVSQDGTTVAITYVDSVENIITTIEENAGSAMGGMPVGASSLARP